MNAVRPGAGFNADPSTLDANAVADYAKRAASQSTGDFILHLIPATFIDAFTGSGDLLQVLFVAILFGYAMTHMGATGKVVHQFILQEFLPGEDPDELTSSTPLITGGILDSISTLKLVVFLEERFGISIEAYEAGVEHLDSISQIARNSAARAMYDTGSARGSSSAETRP